MGINLALQVAIGLAGTGLIISWAGFLGVIKKGPSDPPYNTIMPVLGVGAVLSAMVGFVWMVYAR